MPKYFVKNGLIHRYPVPYECEVTYEGEETYDYLSDVPDGYSICNDCTFHSNDLYSDCVSHMNSSHSAYISENIPEYRPEE